MSAHTGLDMPRQSTHWDDCYNYHHECAVAKIIALQARVAELERDGPIMLPGLCRTKTDGTPVPTTMREALNDYRAAAGAEAEEGDKLRARVAELDGQNKLLTEIANCGVRPDVHHRLLKRAEAERDAAKDGWRKECDDADDICELLGLRSDAYRTEGGSLNVPHIRTLLQERDKAICSQKCPHYMDALAQRDAALALLKELVEFLRAFDLTGYGSALRDRIDALLAGGGK